MDRSDLLSFLQRSKAGKVTELDLSNKGIEELPLEIGEITTLKTLNLSFNSLKELPSTICNLINLEKLYLTRNSISRLPIGIGNLSKLKHLDISYNPLGKIPREFGLFCNLETLDASFCELKTLPVELTNLFNLKEMNLEDNTLEFPPQKVVKRGLYATMHYLTIEKRKNEASRVMLQVFNMPEKIQPAFKQYIRYFNQLVSQANSKEVIFNLNFINQDFYQEMDLNAGVEGYLYDVMRYIQSKMELLKSSEPANDNTDNVYLNIRMNDIKEKLSHLNESLDENIDEIRKLKREIKGFYDTLNS
ncbi:MAG: leucine-rich repeat domain-containing protein [Salinivirgaceae bacterium]